MKITFDAAKVFGNRHPARRAAQRPGPLTPNVAAMFHKPVVAFSFAMTMLPAKRGPQARFSAEMAAVLLSHVCVAHHRFRTY
jgi:hypothetical protein